jgi:hypothetical protein
LPPPSSVAAGVGIGPARGGKSDSQRGSCGESSRGRES